MWNVIISYKNLINKGYNDNMKFQKSIFIIITSLIVIGIVYLGLKMGVEKYEQAEKQKALSANILVGTTLEPIKVEI